MNKTEYKKWAQEKLDNNKEKLKVSGDVCCYHCLRIFKFDKIKTFIDSGATAVCPYCSVDAVGPIDLKNKEKELELIKAARDFGF